MLKSLMSKEYFRHKSVGKAQEVVFERPSERLENNWLEESSKLRYIPSKEGRKQAVLMSW